MKPIECNIFSTRDLNIESLPAFNGSLYVDGNLYLANPDTPLEDFEDIITPIKPVELFGDVFVTGTLYGNKIIIHGNLECTNINCNMITVDGNINVKKNATAIYEMSSTSGNIHVFSADSNSIIAAEGSIQVDKDLCTPVIKAFDSIYVGRDFNEAREIISGDTVTIKRYLETITGARIYLGVYSGGFSCKDDD